MSDLYFIGGPWAGKRVQGKTNKPQQWYGVCVPEIDLPPQVGDVSTPGSPEDRIHSYYLTEFWELDHLGERQTIYLYVSTEIRHQPLRFLLEFYSTQVGGPEPKTSDTDGGNSDE